MQGEGFVACIHAERERQRKRELQDRLASPLKEKGYIGRRTEVAPLYLAWEIPYFSNSLTFMISFQTCQGGGLIICGLDAQVLAPLASA